MPRDLRRSGPVEGVANARYNAVLWTGNSLRCKLNFVKSGLTKSLGQETGFVISDTALKAGAICLSCTAVRTTKHFAESDISNRAISL